MKKLLVYPAIFIPSEGKYAVYFPDLPGCNPYGDTKEEAYMDAVEGLASYLEMLEDEKEEIPIPSDADKAYSQYKKEEGFEPTAFLQLVPAPELSGKLVRANLSLKEYNLEMIDRKADALGMTRSSLVVAAVRAYEPVEA